MKYYEIKRYLVLPRKYSSTVKGVLQYFHGSTGTRENCSVLSTECLAWNCFILVYPFSR